MVKDSVAGVPTVSWPSTNRASGGTSRARPSAVLFRHSPASGSRRPRPCGQRRCWAPAGRTRGLGLCVCAGALSLPDGAELGSGWGTCRCRSPLAAFCRFRCSWGHEVLETQW